MKTPDLYVEKRLFVGCGDPVGLGVGPTEIRGSAYIEGPMIVGNVLTYPTAEANLMVARCVNVDALTPPPPSIFKVSSKTLPPTPVDVVLGDIAGKVGISVNSIVVNIINDKFINIRTESLTGTGRYTWNGDKVLTGVVAESGAEARNGKESVSGATVDNGSKVINGTLNVNGIFIAERIATPRIVAEYGAFTNVAAPFKKFDIPHPTRSGHRLVHTCLEGPEIGVYYRGKLKDSNVILLPEYWRGLVDAESITVNLTPHEFYQELFVKSIEWGTKINIQNNSGGAINCSYVVYGKRKDVPDLEVEYEGNEMRTK